MKRKPVFEVNFFKGEINDNINNIAPTIRGSMPLQTTEKGIAAFTNNNANSLDYTLTLNGTYSIVAFVKFIGSSGLTRYICDFRTNGGVGYMAVNTSNNLISQTGSRYIDNIATTSVNYNKYKSFIINGQTLTCSKLNLFIFNGYSANMGGYCSYFAIYSGTLTAQERAQIQEKFNKISNLRVPKYYKPALDNGLVLNENFIYDKADNTSLTPRDWIKGTGTFKINQAIADSGTIKAKDKYLECVTAGTIAISSKTAYGTWEFDIYKGADANIVIISILSILKELYGNNSYRFYFNSNESVLLTRGSNSSNITIIGSNNPYIIIQTWYRIKVTRSVAGVFTMYIKGGVFGSNYVQVSTSGGSGTNPVTDNTYTTSNYFVCDLDAGDRIANIKIKNV